MRTREAIRLLSGIVPILALTVELAWIFSSWNDLPNTLAGRCGSQGGKLSLFYNKLQFAVLLSLCSLFVVAFSVRIATLSPTFAAKPHFGERLSKSAS